MTRRDALADAGALAAAVDAEALAGWEPSERYPDPAIRSLDPSFDKYRLALAGVERIATGCRFNEGAVYFGDARCLLWSDIPNNRIMRWDEETGRVSVYRKPSNHANGNTRDRQGRLVTCEHSGRRITRTEYGGTITVLIDKFDGKPLNGTNDVVVKSDDSIWFTDPPSGIAGNYLGEAAKQELPNNLYRLDPRTRHASVATTGLVQRPNGLAFAPDESKLYVIESGDPRAIYVFDVVDQGATLANGRVLIKCKPDETPDGLRIDVDGNLWCGWGMGPPLDGVKVFNPAGKAIGFIALPERAANVCFGGPKRKPPVHGGEPFGLFAVCEHAGCARRLTTMALHGEEPR
jgi:gluconolactonase